MSSYFKSCREVGYVGTYTIYDQYAVEDNEVEGFRANQLECGYGKSRDDALKDLTNQIDGKMAFGFRIHPLTYFRPLSKEMLTSVKTEEYTPWYISILNFFAYAYNNGATLDYNLDI